MAVPIVPRRGLMDTGFTSSSACGYGNPRSSTAFTVLKMAVFAPMPSASTSSATTANPRLLFNVRKAKRTSCPNDMLDLAWQLGEPAHGDSLRPTRKPHHPLWPRHSHERGASSSRRVVPSVAAAPHPTMAFHESRVPRRSNAASAPAQLGSDILENALEHVGVVVHAELIGDREEQRIRCHDRLVTGELFDERVGLTRVRAAEDGTRVGVDVADLILVVGVATEIRAVAVIDDREDAAAHGHARLTPVSGLLPGLTIGFDLLSLLDVQRLAGLVFFQSRALQVHAELRGPPGRRIGARTPPDPLAQTFGMRLETQQSRRI